MNSIEVFWAVRNPYRLMPDSDLICPPIKVEADRLHLFANGYKHRWSEFNIKLYLNEDDALTDSSNRLHQYGFRL